MIKKINEKLVLLVAVVFAAVVGGVTTTAVRAAIPGNDNMVHACYNTNNGTLKVVDTDIGQSCTGAQSAISWPATANAGEQVAYVTFNDDGTIATTGSKNILDAQVLPDGWAPGSGLVVVCFKVAFTPKSGFGTSAYGGQYSVVTPVKTIVQTDIDTMCGSSGFNAVWRAGNSVSMRSDLWLYTFRFFEF
jgi:hypothetical protein